MFFHSYFLKIIETFSPLFSYQKPKKAPFDIIFYKLRWNPEKKIWSKVE